LASGHAHRGCAAGSRGTSPPKIRETGPNSTPRRVERGWVSRPWSAQPMSVARSRTDRQASAASDRHAANVSTDGGVCEPCDDRVGAVRILQTARAEPVVCGIAAGIPPRGRARRGRAPRFPVRSPAGRPLVGAVAGLATTIKMRRFLTAHPLSSPFRGGACRGTRISSTTTLALRAHGVHAREHDHPRDEQSPRRTARSARRLRSARRRSSAPRAPG
jgi:hypothetical protein